MGSQAFPMSDGPLPRRDQAGPLPKCDQERGSALVVALLAMILMTLLGFAFVLAGQTETRIAINKRDAEQALFVAEGGVRAVRHWFDAPAGSPNLPVPTVLQMNRTLRWVDDQNDGNYRPYTSAAAPYDVVYRQGTSDPFEHPYRGNPRFTLLGTEDHPDVRISEEGSSAERGYLDTLNATLFPSFPAVAQRTRIYQIDVYAPPILLVSGQRIRYGIATIKVLSGVYEFAGSPRERRIATRMAKAVLNELPIPGPLGPLQSNVNIDTNAEFTVHWGKVTSTGDMTLPNNLTGKVPSSVPMFNRSRIIARDMDLDGSIRTSTTTATPDDMNHDGIPDFDTWIASNNVEDPWLKFWAEGTITNAPRCGGADCQSMPWWDGSSFGTGSNDHSNLFQHYSEPTFPVFEYKVWKEIARGGGSNVFYYASDGRGTGTYRLEGAGPSVTFRAATEGKQGLFFFDTATNSEPEDTNGDGQYDNLADPIQVNGGGYHAAGIIYLNADVRTTGSGGAPIMTVMAPGEPYIDANGNGDCDPDEYFVEMTYPGAIDGTFAKNGMRRGIDGYTRKVPSESSAVGGRYATGVNVYGVLYTNGNYDAQGNWIYYGAVVTNGGMSGSSGTPDIYFDERLVTGRWPPPDIDLPRTMITAWETDN